MNVAIVLCVSFIVFQSQVIIAMARAIEDTSDSSSSEEELLETAQACVDELHIDKKLISDINQEEIAPEDNEQFNQFVGCFWEKEEWIDTEGNVKYDKLLNALVEVTETNLGEDDPELNAIIIENMKIAMAYCENNPPKGSSNGQTAVKTKNCVIKKMNELIDEVDFSSSEEEALELSSKEENCVNELKLDQQYITKLNNMYVAPEDSDDFNKFLACYWMKEEWMDSNGEINYDSLLSALKEMVAMGYQGENHEIKSIIKKRLKRAVAYCREHSTKGENYGQTAAKLQNCITEKLDKTFST